MQYNASILFESKLILQHWVLNTLEVIDYSTLQNWLKDPDLEGFDAENISRFHHVLVARLVNRQCIQKDDLLRYDINIVCRVGPIRPRVHPTMVI